MTKYIETLSNLIDFVSANDLTGAHKYLEDITSSEKDHPELVELYTLQLAKRVTKVHIYEADIDYSKGRIPKTKYVLANSGQNIIQLSCYWNIKMKMFFSNHQKLIQSLINCLSDTISDYKLSNIGGNPVFNFRNESCIAYLKTDKIGNEIVITINLGNRLTGNFKNINFGDQWEVCFN